MKRLMMTALVAGQIVLAAQPATAADFGDERGAVAQRQGAFAGARLRVPLAGAKGQKPRAGLAIAPIAQGRQADGSVRTRFGEGLELGFAGRDKPILAYGGQPVARLAQGPVGTDGRRANVSTGKGLLIVGGIVVVALAGLALLVVSQE
jgi:hypothetical protein